MRANQSLYQTVHATQGMLLLARHTADSPRAPLMPRFIGRHIMSWSYVQKLIWNTEDKWSCDLCVVPAGVVITVWVGDTHHSFLVGLAAAVPVMVLREVL